MISGCENELPGPTSAFGSATVKCEPVTLSLLGQGRRGTKPRSRRGVKARDRQDCARSIVRSRLGEAENDHCPVAHEADNESFMRYDIALDQRLEFGEQITGRFRSEGLGQSGEARQVQEHDRNVLMNALFQKSGVFQDMPDENGDWNRISVAVSAARRPAA